MKNKGFASTGVLYTILIIFLTLILLLLIDLQTKKSILDSIKEETVSAIDSKLECSYLDDKLNDLEKKYEKLLADYQDLLKQLETTNATKKDILEGKTAYSQGNIITGIIKSNKVNKKLTKTETYTIPEGYHDGSGKVSVDLSKIATAITNKGVATSNNDTIETMASNINNINIGIPKQITGEGISSKSFECTTTKKAPCNIYDKFEFTAARDYVFIYLNYSGSHSSYA